MSKELIRPFDTDEYLSTPGPGRIIVRLRAREIFSVQGERADCLFYLQAGRAKLTVVSNGGKEATVTLLAPGDFFGEECVTGSRESRTTSATTLMPSRVLKIQREELIRVLHDEQVFSDLFVKFIAERGRRTQADLIDQLFNNSERRLARTLLLMANFGEISDPDSLIAPITQETLANMIGTTRSRVSFFMNRFRRLGYIEYHGRIRVNRSLLNMIIHNKLPDENASQPALLDLPANRNHHAAKNEYAVAR
jgi:CRP/FNR family transcriptional regulator, cyclic AMP receptor protein